jgi:hypothetical protein
MQTRKHKYTDATTGSGDEVTLEVPVYVTSVPPTLRLNVNGGDTFEFDLMEDDGEDDD